MQKTHLTKVSPLGLTKGDRVVDQDENLYLVRENSLGKVYLALYREANGRLLANPHVDTEDDLGKLPKYDPFQLAEDSEFTLWLWQ